jgi:hypothetical protein
MVIEDGEEAWELNKIIYVFFGSLESNSFFLNINFNKKLKFILIKNFILFL